MWNGDFNALWINVIKIGEEDYKDKKNENRTNIFNNMHQTNRQTNLNQFIYWYAMIVRRIQCDAMHLFFFAQPRLSRICER